MNNRTNIWWLHAIRGFLFFLLGFIIFKDTIQMLLTQQVLFTVILTVSGVLLILTAFLGWRAGSRWWWLSNGLLDLVFAAVFYNNPALAPNFFPLLLAFWTISTGVLQFGSAFEYRRERRPYWWSSIVAGVLLLLFAFLIFRMFPNSSQFEATILFGLQMFFIAFYSIGLSFLIRGSSSTDTAVSRS